MFGNLQCNSNLLHRFFPIRYQCFVSGFEGAFHKLIAFNRSYIQGNSIACFGFSYIRCYRSVFCFLHFDGIDFDKLGGNGHISFRHNEFALFKSYFFFTRNNLQRFQHVPFIRGCCHRDFVPNHYSHSITFMDGKICCRGGLFFLGSFLHRSGRNRTDATAFGFRDGQFGGLRRSYRNDQTAFCLFLINGSHISAGGIVFFVHLRRQSNRYRFVLPFYHVAYYREIIAFFGNHSYDNFTGLSGSGFSFGRNRFGFGSHSLFTVLANKVFAHTAVGDGGQGNGCMLHCPKDINRMEMAIGTNIYIFRFVVCIFVTFILGSTGNLIRILRRNRSGPVVLFNILPDIGAPQELFVLVGSIFAQSHVIVRIIVDSLHSIDGCSLFFVSHTILKAGSIGIIGTDVDGDHLLGPHSYKFTANNRRKHCFLGHTTLELLHIDIAGFTHIIQNKLPIGVVHIVKRGISGAQAKRRDGVVLHG